MELFSGNSDAHVGWYLCWRCCIWAFANIRGCVPGRLCGGASPARSCEDAHALLCVFSTTLSATSAMFVFSSQASLKLRRRGNWEMPRVLIFDFFISCQLAQQLCNSTSHVHIKTLKINLQFEESASEVATLEFVSI